MVHDSLIFSNCYMNVAALLAPMPGISEAFTGTRLNDPLSEVDVTKYQQIFLASLPGKA